MPRPGAKRREQALARIQRLCCLGLGGEMLMPDLIQEVMELIPSHQAVFFWLGADLEIANAYTTIPASYVEVLRTNFYAKRREWDYFRSPKELMKAPAPNNVQRFDQILHTDHRAFLCSDYYIWSFGRSALMNRSCCEFVTAAETKEYSTTSRRAARHSGPETSACWSQLPASSPMA
jgi:hypothetical protein